MTRTHVIKLREEFADSVSSGDKRFEVRENDRGYQRGDFVKFKVVDRTGISVCGHWDLECMKFRITYVISGWGLKNGFVAFGIEEVRDD